VCCEAYKGVDHMNPMVSICLPTYNQASYIEATLRSLLAQTYSPLEIVIADDCSPDGTADIIDRMTTEYRRGGGVHEIRFYRNEMNLGGLRNYEKVFSLAKGELIVDAGGDDVAEPDRVARIVEAWINANEQPTVIVHDGWRIDPQGRRIGVLEGRGFVELALGAATAYTPDVVRKFSPVETQSGYEDHIFGFRALMLGPGLKISDKLIEYRVGSGVSSVLMSHRPIDIKDAGWTIDSCRQSLKDLESKKSQLSSDRYQELKEQITDYLKRTSARKMLYASDSLLERLWGYFECRKNSTFRGAVFQLVYLLPHRLCDRILDGFSKVKYRRQLRRHGAVV